LIQSIWDGKLSGVIFGTIPCHQTMFVLLALGNPVVGAAVVAVSYVEMNPCSAALREF
jgi:hypothetical protein